jgi:hypothetical protein
VRLAVFTVSETRFLDYFTGRLRIVNIPEGAQLTAWWRDGSHLCLRLAHESFPETSGFFPQRLPRIRARYMRVVP